MSAPHAATPVIMVFLKSPTPGNVKTRLAETIGPEEAADIYRIMAESQLRRIPEDFTTEVHYTPRDAGDVMREWLGSAPMFVAQSDGDLGARLSHAFDSAFSSGRRAAIAIGADCPTLDADTLRLAAAALLRVDVVVGPANDGGYYLIGMRRPVARVFADIQWSSGQVLETTIERIRSSGLTWNSLQKMEDIDDEESLRRYIASALSSQNASRPPLIHV